MSDNESGKKKFNLSLNQSQSNIPKLSEFDNIINNIDATVIPVMYISYINVIYNDGTIVTLNSEYIKHPLPVNKPKSWKDLGEHFEDIKDVKVFINVELLEKNINQYVDSVYSKFGLKRRQ